MKKSHSDEKSDILDERYKGPGPVVASAGYMALSHLATTIVGLLAFGALGALASGKTIAVKEAFTKFGTAHGDSSNIFKKAAGFIIGGIPKIADLFATKVTGIAKKASRGRIGHVDETDKAAAFMFAGGIGGAAGWIGSTIWGIAKGGHEGSIGKRQFNRAKAEIKDLRERNDDLEKINNELHTKYVEAATQKDSAEQSTSMETDATSAPREHHEETQHDKPAHSIHAHTDHAAEHHGKVHAHQQHEHGAHAHS